MRWTLLTLLMACSDHQPVQEGEADSTPVDAAPVPDAGPDCGCVGTRHQWVAIGDVTLDPANVRGPAGVDICGIEVRCGDRTLVGTRAALDPGEFYCDECPREIYQVAERALDSGEVCSVPPLEGTEPEFVSLGFGGALFVYFPDAGPCGLAGCQITVREGDSIQRENQDSWETAVCESVEGPCVLTSAGREYLDGTATVDCCTCE